MFPQVRNLCYMVTRRERTKHAICKLQEQIFHLQMKLIEQDLCRGRRLPGPPPATSVCTLFKGLGPKDGMSLAPGGGMSVGLPPLPSIIQLVGQDGPLRSQVCIVRQGARDWNVAPGLPSESFLAQLGTLR